MLQDSKVNGSRVGLWNRPYENLSYNPKIYGDPTTAKKAGAFLTDESIKEIEDWGCGYGGFKNHIGQNQEYIGIDGSNSKFASIIADLEIYTSCVDAIHMRHILEHNPNWEKVLKNAINSFQKKMVLTIFTPFQDETRIIETYPNYNDTGIDMIDIGFKRSEIIEFFKELEWESEENIKTESIYGVEHIFYLNK